jgi:uncharacterized membrane protein YqjE
MAEAALAPAAAMAGSAREGGAPARALAPPVPDAAGGRSFLRGIRRNGPRGEAMDERAGEGTHRAGAEPGSAAHGLVEPAARPETHVLREEGRPRPVEHPPHRNEAAARPEPGMHPRALRPTAGAARIAETRPEEQRDLRQLPVRDLVTEIARTVSLLARKEIELAKNELREDLRAEIKMAGGLGVAGVCGLIALEMLLVTIAFAVQESGALPGWAASLVIAAIVLGIGTAAGLWGWAKRVRTPLDTTRRSIQENVRWARDRIA